MFRRVTLLCLGSLLLATSAVAQDYDSVVLRILEAGKVDGPIHYLEFRDGSLRQYAALEVLSPVILHVSFVEESWNKVDGNDVIDQWIVEVTPDLIATHTEIVEHDSQVLTVRKLSTQGAERVVQRIAEKAVGITSPVL